MKKHVFGYVKIKDTPRRYYGGHNYTLAVYDLTGGNVERIGEVSACTAAHKGEASEAWSVVIEKRPAILRTLAKRAKASSERPASAATLESACLLALRYGKLLEASYANR